MGFNADMFEGTHSASSRDKKPTFLQWVKSASAAKLKKSYIVETIWKPGTWDNFTLETDEFRIRITREHPMYAAMDAFTADQNTANTQLSISPVGKGSKEFAIHPKETDGLWSELGDNGLSWMP